MSMREVVDILITEKQCVERAETGCDRDCANCDLVKPAQDILNAYDAAISFIKQFEDTRTIIKCDDCKYFDINYRYCNIFETDMERCNFCGYAERR